MGCSLVFFVFSVVISVGFSEDCQTPLGARSQCVSLYNCPQLLSAFTQKPLPERVVSFLRYSQCGFDGSIPRVCCGPLPEERQTQRPVETPTDSGIDIESANQEDSYPSRRGECGIETNGDRIYGGEKTELDEFPWMALLGYRRPDGSRTYQCSGVLINHRYVLTAAHCVTGAIETEVGRLATARLGEYDTQAEIDCMDNVCADPPQEIPVHRSYPHPGYADRNKNKRDDIGIIRLARRAQFTNYVKPICLPDTRTRVGTGYEVFVAGWGKTLQGTNSPVKLKLGVPIFDKNDCVNKYSTLGANLIDKQLCAGGNFAKDSCRGDSGGPLMMWQPEGSWVSVGVVSFGYGCGRDGWPGVYTSVASYLDWIQSTLTSSNQ